MKPDEFPHKKKNKSPSTVLRHPLRTPSSLPHNATKLEEKGKADLVLYSAGKAMVTLR